MAAGPQLDRVIGRFCDVDCATGCDGVTEFVAGEQSLSQKGRGFLRQGMPGGQASSGDVN